MKRVIFKATGPFVGCSVESEIEEYPDDVTEEELHREAETFFFNEGFEYWFEIVDGYDD